MAKYRDEKMNLLDSLMFKKLEKDLSAVSRRADAVEDRMIRGSRDQQPSFAEIAEIAKELDVKCAIVSSMREQKLSTSQLETLVEQDGLLEMLYQNYVNDDIRLEIGLQKSTVELADALCAMSVDARPMVNEYTDGASDLQSSFLEALHAPTAPSKDVGKAPRSEIEL